MQREINYIIGLIFISISTLLGDPPQSLNDLFLPVYFHSDQILSDKDINSVLDTIDFETSTIIPILINASTNRDSLINSINPPYQSKCIADLSESVPDLLKANQQLLVLSRESSQLSITTYESLKQHYRKTPLDTMKEFSTIEAPIYNAWHRTGKIPNIVIIKDKQNYNHLENKARAINNYPRVYGSVTFQNQPLNDVTWTEIPGLITNGDFTIPIHQSVRFHLSPQKEGYKFSPDITYFTAGTVDKKRYFRAYLKDISDQLVAHFTFENTIINQLNDEKLLVHNVQLIDDENRGNVAKFSGRNSYIDCDNSIDFGNHGEMTLALWIKPTQVSANHAFLGKGLDFSFKIRETNPTFTTADIRDHYLTDIKIDSAQWQHIAMVVKENQTVKFYKNGQFEGEMPASQIIESEKSLLLGTNLWDEFYAGYMDDLKLWNRALNNIEIKRIYQLPLKSNQYSLRLFIYLVWAIIFISVVIIVRKIPFKALVKPQKSTPKTAIYFFGALKIKDGQSENLQEKLSPKMKQIFILLLIYSIKSNGITTKKLTDILWPGFSPAKAKNNRSTYFGKLRNFLKNIEGLDLLYADKKWSIKFSDSLFIDYSHVLTLLSSNYQNQTTPLIKLLSRGQFLPGIECEWLDEYRLELTQQLDHYLQQFQSRNNIKKQPEQTFELATQIKKFDSLNETALTLQIKAQIILGNHSLAKKCYDVFAREYEALYNVPYEKKFLDFME